MCSWDPYAWDPVEALAKSRLGQWLARLLSGRGALPAYDPLHGMLMHIAMSDGKYVASEGETLHRVMVRFMGSGTQEDELAVLQQLRSGAWKTKTFREHCNTFARLSEGDAVSRDLALEALVSLAACDAQVDATQQRLIEEAREILGVPSGRVEAFLARAAGDYSFKRRKREEPHASRRIEPHDGWEDGEHAWAYAELECESGASLDQVKQQYRRLVKEFHPDALRARGASKVIIEQGHQRFLRIQRAYDTLQGNG